MNGFLSNILDNSITGHTVVPIRRLKLDNWTALNGGSRNAIVPHQCHVSPVRIVRAFYRVSPATLWNMHRIRIRIRIIISFRIRIRIHSYSKIRMGYEWDRNGIGMEDFEAFH